MALPPEHRLRGHRAFERLYRKGRRLQGEWLVLRLLNAEPRLLRRDDQHHAASRWRCGVVVSSKVHKRAVRRNRLRRLLHGELLRLLRQAPPLPHEPLPRDQLPHEPSRQDPLSRDPLRQDPSHRDPLRGDPLRRDPLRRDTSRREPPPGTPPTSRPQWLLLSLRPGSADADEHRLLGECRDLLHQAGLLP